MPTYLVTGGAGFIGCNIVRALVQTGETVKVFDNLSTGTLDNLKDIEGGYEFIMGDIQNLRDVKKAVQDVDYILHHAAIRAVARSVDNPLETNAINITGTLNVLLAAKSTKVKALVYASSSAVYGELREPKERSDHGNVEVEKNVESHCPNPESPYALSKLTGEYYCRQFSKLYNLPTISLRYFNVFGPYQNPESKYSAVIPIFVERLLAGQTPAIEWDGHQSRDFVYIDNVVQANLAAAQHAHEQPGEFYNIGNGENVSVNDMLTMLQKLLGTNIKPKYIAKRPGDVRQTFADVSKAKRDLGYSPTVNFEQGLKRSIEWYKQALRA